MFWPVILPLQITFTVLCVAVLAMACLAPRFNWKPTKTFFLSGLLAAVVFIPSCIGVMTVVDAQRFGVFSYDNYSKVGDHRVYRYLPTKSKSVALQKYASGHRAKYSISESDLTTFLDDLWSQYGKNSAISRKELNDGQAVSTESIGDIFGDLGWPPLQDPIELHSPYGQNGAGATYYFDRTSGVAYHRAGYW